MSESLPLRANLQWLKKQAKDRLAVLRAANPAVKLADAQRELAHQFGFASWRKLKHHVESVEAKLGELVSPAQYQAAAKEQIPPDDPAVAQLLKAAYDGDLAAALALLKARPALARAAGVTGETALHAAAECNDARLGALLLAYGADASARFGQSGHTPLSWAVTCHAMEFAQAMIKLGTKPDLFCAAGCGAQEQVRSYFDASGNLLPGASQTGSSRYAADGSRLPCPPQPAREQISDALYIACRNAQVEVVRFLLTKNPDLAFCAYEGGTPLHWAHFGGSAEIIRLLEAAGADPAARDRTLGCTPRGFGILIPASWGFAFLVARRLANDSGLAGIEDGGTTPLHLAAGSGSAETIRLLLDAGADRTKKDASGQTPAQVAQAGGHAEAAALLAGG